ncbi:MAG: outer membrane protein assembly factor BamA [Pseudomonadota bacterium]
MLLTAVLSLPVSLVATSEASAQTVSQIVIEGNQRIDDDTIRSYMSLEPGRGYSAFLADESLKALFETGLFEDVRIQRRGSSVVVTVVENPVVNRVAFEGNKKLKDEVLSQEVQLQPRSTYSRAKVQADTQRILEIYRRTGRFGARVEPKLIQLPQNRVDVVFEIDEDKKTGVTRINFVGNRAFGEGTLREVITTKQSGILNFLRATDIYDPDRLQADQELLRRYYLTKGYADFRVVSATADFDPEGNAFFVTFTVDEGEKYTFGDVEIETTISDLDPSFLRSSVRTRPGDTYDAELVDKTLEALTVEVATRGYAFAQVRPDGIRDPESRTISLVYFIEEGPRVYIERIDIVGNTRTLDRVIRREFDLAEGDAFNSVLIRRAERRLNALGYFESVRISNSPGTTPDRVVVTVEVVEQPTGQLEFGAGFSTADGLIGDVSITERNLLGRGQSIRAALSVSADRTTFDFSFTEPWFLDRRVSAGFDVFVRDVDLEDESSYTSERRGGRLRLGFLLAENLSLSLNYTFEQEEIIVGNTFKPDYDHDNDGVDSFLPGSAAAATGINPTDLDADAIRSLQAAGLTVVPTNISPFILATEGETTTSSAGFALTYNRLDFPREPRNGFFAQLRTDVAGLGGDTFYFRAVAQARAYREIFPDVIAVARVEGGAIQSLDGDGVNLNDSFFRGPDLVRGFRSAGIGPRARRTIFNDDGTVRSVDETDALGGEFYWGSTAEVRFPFWGIPKSIGLSGAVFADAGALFNVGDTGNLPTVVNAGNDVAGDNQVRVQWDVLDDATIRASAGVGVIWKSPFGPLRADFAWPLAQEDYDRTQFFRFSGGTRF